MAQTYRLMLNGQPVEAAVEDGPTGRRVRLGDRWFTVDLQPLGEGLYSLLIDGRSFEAYADARRGGWDILVGNQVHPIDLVTERGRGTAAAAGEPAGVWTLRSPLAGIVVELRVAAGDRVEVGQAVLVVESMKINNELKAARAGTVLDVLVSVGQRVERAAPLVRIGDGVDQSAQAVVF